MRLSALLTVKNSLNRPCRTRTQDRIASVPPPPMRHMRITTRSTLLGPRPMRFLASEAPARMIRGHRTASPAPKTKKHIPITNFIIHPLHIPTTCRSQRHHTLLRRARRQRAARPSRAGRGNDTSPVCVPALSTPGCLPGRAPAGSPHPPPGRRVIRRPMSDLLLERALLRALQGRQAAVGNRARTTAAPPAIRPIDGWSRRWDRSPAGPPSRWRSRRLGEAATFLGLPAGAREDRTHLVIWRTVTTSLAAA
jgi:hypothetical protein